MAAANHSIPPFPLLISTQSNTPSTNSSSRDSPSSRTTPLSPVPNSPGNNRFALSLSNMLRPRSSSRSTSRPSRPIISPAAENPPSPSGLSTSENRSGYFPSIRRTLSKRPSSSSGGQLDNAANVPSTSTSGLLGFGTRTVMQRSRSQPRTPISDLVRSEGRNSSRPHTSSGGGATTPLLPAQQISFSTASRPATAGAENSTTETHSFRLVPHLESNRSLHFDPVDRKILPFIVVSIGRFTDRSPAPPAAVGIGNSSDPARIAFKSKVVSRGHAEIWCDETGKFLIRDTKSSSGTFLNHIRLSGPGLESKPFVIKDGDILQLGVDYQGGTEEIYRCVKMRVELNRGWQKKKSAFNTNALKQLRELGGTSTPTSTAMEPSTSNLTTVQPRKTSSVTDCCICLYPVTVCQALFIAPCSHVTHFSCIRPLINKTYPGHTCPVCRTYADLEADVTIDEESEVDEPVEEETESINLDDTISIVEAELEENSAVLAVIGPGGSTVPLLIRSNSRSASIRSSKSNRTSRVFAPMSSAIPDEDLIATIPLQALALDFNLSKDENSFESSTPLNTVFLSTLAESNVTNRPSSKLSSTAISKTNSNNSEFHESNEFIGSSKSNHPSARRNSIDSETDGTEEVSSLEEMLSRGKGKGRVTAIVGEEVI